MTTTTTPVDPALGHDAGPGAFADIRAALVRAETERRQQLEALPAVGLEPVAAAYRASVERILADVRTALRRLDAGSYGVCSGCGAEIPPARLELRPWATACARCASGERR